MKHIKINNKLIINADDILFISACAQYVELHFLDEIDAECKVENKIHRVVTKESKLNSVTALGSIKNLARTLPENFVKANRYVILNMEKVSRIEKVKVDEKDNSEKTEVTFKGGFKKKLKGNFCIISKDLIVLSKMKVRKFYTKNGAKKRRK